MTLIMNYGEIRHIRLKVINCKNESFSILSATYVLAQKDGNVINSGQADILEHVLDTLIGPLDKGVYIIEFTYKIADETLIDKVEIRVM